MTPLTQQLEDKKKGCENKELIHDHQCGKYCILCEEIYLCEHCKKIIAILEQAIAEMQKQRQDFIDKISLLRDELYNKLPTGDLDAFVLIKIIQYHIKKLDELQQLNQPKTEEAKHL